MATFTLDFADGRCRYARGRSLDEAIEDALMACEATDTPCNILDDKLRRVAEVNLSHTGHTPECVKMRWAAIRVKQPEAC
jgi:hypothetical protein